MDINTVELFQTVVEELPLGFVLYSPDNKVLVVNKKTESLSRVSRDQIVGQTLSVKDKQGTELWFLTQILFPSVAPKMKHISPPGEYPQVVDVSFTNPRLEVRTTTLKLNDPSGAVAGYVKLIEDRTREAVIMESKHEFVSLVSHQLRTPLTAVNWTFQLLLKDHLSDNEREIAETGARAAAELVARIDDAVEVAKIEDGRFDYKFASVDLINILNEVIKRLRLLAGQYGVTIATDWSDEQLMVTADRHKLSVAVANIIDNGMRYSVGGGTVTVRAIKQSSHQTIELSVHDDGIGIPESDRPNLFSKFFRAENARKVQPDGNGLGLFIAKNIIDAHGGKIDIDSTLNQGSTFMISLPTDPNLIPVLKQE
jgi:signal transduction histidine kinase